jgi:hypothetical protein
MKFRSYLKGVMAWQRATVELESSLAILYSLLTAAERRASPVDIAEAMINMNART